jgi:hypothetical protein
VLMWGLGLGSLLQQIRGCVMLMALAVSKTPACRRLRNSIEAHADMPVVVLLIWKSEPVLGLKALLPTGTALEAELTIEGAWLGAVACLMDVLGILLPIVLGIMFVVTTMAYFRIHGGLENICERVCYLSKWISFLQTKQLSHMIVLNVLDVPKGYGLRLHYIMARAREACGENLSGIVLHGRFGQQMLHHGRER